MLRMRDHPTSDNEWAQFVRELATRPGWSIARLAREAGIHRSTIFRWINGDFASARLPNIKLFAEAAQIDYNLALRAATGAKRQADAEDEGAVGIIIASDASDQVKRELIEHVRARRQQHEAERLREIELILRTANAKG